jgi:Ni,Fe-hydrogenase I cytochrome b subunit
MMKKKKNKKSPVGMPLYKDKNLISYVDYKKMLPLFHWVNVMELLVLMLMTKMTLLIFLII